MTSSRWLLFLVLSSIGLNVFQAYRWRQKIKEPAPLSSFSGRLPAVATVMTEGGLRSISWEQPRTLVYVTDGSCRWCSANEASWRALTAHLCRQEGIMVLRLHRGESPAIPDSCEISVSEKDNHETWAFFAQAGTPLTISVGRGGAVEHAWMGAYEGGLRDSIESFFGVSIPEAGQEAPRNNR